MSQSQLNQKLNDREKCIHSIVSLMGYFRSENIENEKVDFTHSLFINFSLLFIKWSQPGILVVIIGFFIAIDSSKNLGVPSL